VSIRYDKISVRLNLMARKGAFVQTSVAERLRDSLANASATERRVIHALLADYPMLALGTLSDWGTRAGVSAPTILRFLAKIDAGSFPDFQAQLREELSDRLRSPLEKQTSSQASEQGARSLEFGAAICDNVRETFAHLSTSETEAVVKLLSDPKRKIGLVGGRFTDPLARYAAAHLTIVRSGVFTLIGQIDTWRDKLLELRKGDVLVVFDIRRYSSDLQRFCEQAANRKIIVVLITDQWLSPISKVASHVLPARISVPSRWDSNTALMAIVEMLLEAITTRLGHAASQRIGELEALRDGTP
jgi:DNA-binding MurR/RpiR family transcriptional regulator